MTVSVVFQFNYLGDDYYAQKSQLQSRQMLYRNSPSNYNQQPFSRAYEQVNPPEASHAASRPVQYLHPHFFPKPVTPRGYDMNHRSSSVSFHRTASAHIECLCSVSVDGLKSLLFL